MLEPYEERQIIFKFSPRFLKCQTGWKGKDDLPPRNDYAVFLHIQSVGTVNNKCKGDDYFNFKNSNTSRLIRFSVFFINAYILKHLKSY